MGDEFIGSSTEGNGELNVQEIVQETAQETQNQTQSEQNTQGLGTVEDIPGLIARAERAEQEAKRLREYNDFIRQAGNQIQQPQRREPIQLDPDAIPYVKDVTALVEQQVEERLAKINEDRVIADLQTMSEQREAADPNFKRRMECAVEILERDEALVPLFLREQTAAGKIAFLEKIAPWHPMFSSISHAQEQRSNPVVSDAVQRLKATANMPPVLSSVQSSGSGQKLVSQMSDEEYLEHFKKVTKGY